MMLKLLYRAVRRCVVLDVTRLLCADFDFHAGSPETDKDFKFRFVDRKTLESVHKRYELGLSEELLQRLDNDPTSRNHCGAIFHGERLVSYAWFAENGIEARHNRVSDHPKSGVAISMTSTDLFVYAAFTLPEYRGKNLFPSLLCSASVEFRKSGFQRFVSTTEWTNSSARTAFQKVGFADLGMIWKSSVGPHSLIRGPELARQHSILIGQPLSNSA